MSQTSTPGHSSPNSYDSQFDMTFTEAITSKMRVPDTIRIIEGADPPDLILQPHSEMKSRMNVPERILVAGDNHHISLRESLPELKFDTPFPVQLPNLILAAPPNILTVDEYPYPTVETKPEKIQTKTKILDQDLHNTTDLNDSILNTSVNPEEELTKLRVQMRHLSRRVLALEQENQQRQQREIILCAIGVTYIFVKSLLWMHRHF